MASSKYDDTSGDEEGYSMMMKILERLQDALYEETAVSLPTFEDEASDDEQLTSWNVPTTNSGKEFREKIRAFESNNLGIFDVEKNTEEYTFEMSRVHSEFQEIVESGIHEVLRNEFSVSPRDFYLNLLKLRNKDNKIDGTFEAFKNKENGSEILQILFSVLSFEDFARDMKLKASVARRKGQFKK